MKFKSESSVTFSSDEVLSVKHLRNGTIHIYLVERFDFSNMWAKTKKGVVKDMYYGWVSVSKETFNPILAFFHISCSVNTKVYIKDL